MGLGRLQVPYLGSLSWIANHSTEMLFTHIQKPTRSSNMLEKPCLCMQQNCLKFIFARKERQHPLRPRDAGDSKVPHPTCPQPGNRTGLGWQRRTLPPSSHAFRLPGSSRNTGTLPQA